MNAQVCVDCRADCGHATNEHGAYCWNELHTREYERAKDFYAKVFGWSYTENGDGENFSYSTFALPGGEGISGVNDDTKMPGENPPTG